LFYFLLQQKGKMHFVFVFFATNRFFEKIEKDNKQTTNN